MFRRSGMDGAEAEKAAKRAVEGGEDEEEGAGEGDSTSTKSPKKKLRGNNKLLHVNLVCRQRETRVA